MDFDIVFDFSTFDLLGLTEQEQKKRQTFIQLFHYTLVKSHKYTNSAEGNGNDIKTDTGYYMKIHHHHHHHHYILIQQKWKIKTRQWRMVSKNGPWLHPGKRCIKAMCFWVFCFPTKQKVFPGRVMNGGRSCRAAGGRSGGFDGGLYVAYTGKGQLVMRNCKDLLRRYFILQCCVFLLYLVSFLPFFLTWYCKIEIFWRSFGTNSSQSSELPCTSVCLYVDTFSTIFVCDLNIKRK